MRRSGILALVVASTLVLAGCNKSSSSGSPAGGGSPTGSGSATISTAGVAGIGTVLVNPAGYTLYHLKTESANKITCTGSCAQTWPPYLVSGSMPTAGSGVTGKISETSRPDGGQQLTYNGLPLYTYSGDTSPGEANGNGYNNVWFAVSPTSKGSGGGGSGGGGSGYGYGS